MPHKTLTQLSKELLAAARLVKPGAEYMHYKSPLNTYVVSGFCILEATDEVHVLYSLATDPSIVFSRPVREFTETIELNGKKTLRFSLQSTK